MENQGSIRRMLLGWTLPLTMFASVFLSTLVTAQDPDPGMGMALCGGAACAFLIIPFIIGIIVAIWVYKDSGKRGMNQTLWLIITLLTGIIGLIIYLVVRQPLAPIGPAPGMMPPYGAPMPYAPPMPYNQGYAPPQQMPPPYGGPPQQPPYGGPPQAPPPY